MSREGTKGLGDNALTPAHLDQWFKILCPVCDSHDRADLTDFLHHVRTAHPEHQRFNSVIGAVEACAHPLDEDETVRVTAMDLDGDGASIEYESDTDAESASDEPGNQTEVEKTKASHTPDQKRILSKVQIIRGSDGYQALVVRRKNGSWSKIHCKQCGSHKSRTVAGFRSHMRIRHGIKYVDEKEAIDSCGARLDGAELAQIRAVLEALGETGRSEHAVTKEKNCASDAPQATTVDPVQLLQLLIGKCSSDPQAKLVCPSCGEAGEKEMTAFLAHLGAHGLFQSVTQAADQSKGPVGPGKSVEDHAEGGGIAEAEGR